MHPTERVQDIKIKIGQRQQCVSQIDVFTKEIHIKVLQVIFTQSEQTSDQAEPLFGALSVSKKVAEYIDYILEVHSRYIQPVYTAEREVALHNGHTQENVQGYQIPEPREFVYAATGPLGGRIGNNRENDRKEHSVYNLFKALSCVCIFTKRDSQNLHASKRIVDSLHHVKIKDPVMHLFYKAIFEDLSSSFDQYPCLIDNPLYDAIITWAYKNQKITINQAGKTFIVYTLFTLSEANFLEIFAESGSSEHSKNSARLQTATGRSPLETSPPTGGAWSVIDLLYTTIKLDRFCDFIEITGISMNTLLKRINLILMLTNWDRKIQYNWYMELIEHFVNKYFSKHVYMCLYQHANMIRKMNSMRMFKIEEQISMAQKFIDTLSKHVIIDVSKLVLEYL